MKLKGIQLLLVLTPLVSSIAVSLSAQGPGGAVPVLADSAVRPGAVMRMDWLLELTSKHLGPGARIAYLYLRDDEDTTTVVHVEPAIFLVNFRQKGPRYIVLGIYEPGRKPGPRPSYEQDLAIVLLRQTESGQPFEKVWQSEYIGSVFCFPYYLGVSYGDGRLTIRANRTGSPSTWRRTQTDECYEWDENTSSVTVLKKDFGQPIPI